MSRRKTKSTAKKITVTHKKTRTMKPTVVKRGPKPKALAKTKTAHAVGVKALEKLGIQARVTWIAAIKQESKSANKSVSGLKKEHKIAQQALKKLTQQQTKLGLAKSKAAKNKAKKLTLALAAQNRLCNKHAKALDTAQLTANALKALLLKAEAMNKAVETVEKTWKAPEVVEKVAKGSGKAKATVGRKAKKVGRPVGRPKAGSVKTEETATKAKRGRGRPKGSSKKIKRKDFDLPVMTTLIPGEGVDFELPLNESEAS